MRRCTARCVFRFGTARAHPRSRMRYTLSRSARPRLVLCARKAKDAAGLGAKPGQLAVISMPLLSARTDEMRRIVNEAADQLVKEVGAPSSGFTTHDLQRLPNIKFKGMADVEDTVRRVIVMRIFGVTKGAEKLGLKHSSLSTWARSKGRNLST